MAGTGRTPMGTDDAPTAPKIDALGRPVLEDLMETIDEQAALDKTPSWASG
jgi:hypothetical protein